jgi:hypothetical protein
MNSISRHYSDPVTIVCTNSPSTTAKIAFSTSAGGVLTVAATNGATQVVWYAAPDMATTPVPIYQDGAAVVTALTNGAHPFPDATYGCFVLAPVVSNGTMAAVVTVKG